MAQITLSATVQLEQMGQRLDQTLAELFPDYSRSRLKTWIEDDLVLVNGVVQNVPRTKVYGDEHIEITVEIEDETRFEPENIPLNNGLPDYNPLFANRFARYCIILAPVLARHLA